MVAPGNTNLLQQWPLVCNDWAILQGLPQWFRLLSCSCCQSCTVIDCTQSDCQPSPPVTSTHGEAYYLLYAASLCVLNRPGGEGLVARLNCTSLNSGTLCIKLNILLTKINDVCKCRHCMVECLTTVTAQDMVWYMYIMSLIGYAKHQFCHNGEWLASVHCFQISMTSPLHLSYLLRGGGRAVPGQVRCPT